MKEILNFNDSRQKMIETNVIIYGTIRDVENDFFTSFTNIDIICSYFKNAYIIIFENDSNDNTRELLVEWSKKTSSFKIKKHIILKDDLDKLYPLRAHRLAYCRNCILNYIADNNLQQYYSYALHCDLDNRFWSIDFDSIVNCFQYDLNDWDAMTCVNKHRLYYDFWALRCDKSWFNINIFSCDSNNIDYTTKVGGFETLLKNTSGLIPTTSSFNGLGIYKLSSLLPCRYSAYYYCKKCDNKNRGCLEDNDHIGLHKQMIHNQCNIFINNKMCIQTRPEESITYMDFIKNMKELSIKTINKDLLPYLLIKNKIDQTGKWIITNINDGESANLITNYYKNTLYAFDNNKEPKYIYLNKNIKVLHGDFYSNQNNIIESYSNDNEFISFIYINCNSYQTTKQVLESFYPKMKEDCVIIFEKMINFEDYILHSFKSWYEFTQEHEIEFKWLTTNGDEGNDRTMATGTMAAIKILKNPQFNKMTTHIHYSSTDYESFDWIFYSNHHKDLAHIKTKEEAYIHWKNYGFYEGRIRQPEKKITVANYLDDPEFQNFDWEVYVELNSDLKDSGVSTKMDAYHHWKNHGINEGRLYKFDWCTYVKNYNLLGKGIDNKMKAIRYWVKHGKPEVDPVKIDYDNELFDWKYYLHNHDDLKQIDTAEGARYHWDHFGKNEGRSSHNFIWTNYLLANSDLVKSGINTNTLATQHWINHGKYENRNIN